MKKPTITLIGTSIWSRYWDDFFGSVHLNHIPFEIIFVGVVKIPTTSPENFHFIFSKVKPTQCLEIAARAASGNYVMVVADDVTFSPYGIDEIVFWLRRLNKWSVVGCRYNRCREDENERNDQSCLLPWIPNSPVVPICGAMRTDSWHALGGIDRRFIASYGTQDLFLRAFSRGGTPFISPDTIVYERLPEPDKERERLSHIYHRDKKFLRALWIERPREGILLFRETRREPVESFDETTDLRFISQGLKGRWR